MSKTENIGLNLTTDESTKFEDWRKSIDGEGSDGNKSNMQLIDEAFGAQDERILALENSATGGGATGEGIVSVDALSSDTLETEEKTLVGAVNEVNEKAEKNAEDISTLETKIDDLLYKAISITSFNHNKGSVEIGATVTDVTLTWAINKTPSALTLDGAAVGVNETSKAFSGLSIKHDNNKTWTLTATDERGATATKTTKIPFYNGVYYGAAAAPATYDGDFIKTLTKTLTGSKLTSFSASAGEGEYIFYCLPTRLGACTFAVGGFSGGFALVDTIAFTNASGYTENYYIYKSVEANLGSTDVKVS